MAAPTPTSPPPTPTATEAMTAVMPLLLAADTVTSPGAELTDVVVSLLLEIAALVVESPELTAPEPAPATAIPTRPPPIATEAAAATTLIVERDTLILSVV